MRYFSYLRVSTKKQGVSALGLDAQRQIVATWVAQHGGGEITEFVEVESGRKCNRPELAKALAAREATGATLIVAKVDRLSRDADFLNSVDKGCSDGNVIFCDLPQASGAVGRFMRRQMASVAELEAGLISERTKAALAIVKKRYAAEGLGRRLGCPNPGPIAPGIAQAGRDAMKAKAAARAKIVAPYIREARQNGCASLAQIANYLMTFGVQTATGGKVWHPTTVRNTLTYLQ